MFDSEAKVPERIQFPLSADAGADARFVLMPAWSSKYFGVKVFASLPDSHVPGQRILTATYMLFSAESGECLAMIDGDALTTMRTVATSALAARRLARRDARRLFVLGTGRIAAAVPFCFKHVLPIDQVRVWGRNPAKAEALAAQFREMGLDAAAVDQPRSGIEWADVISTATPSQEPLIEGRWVRPGTHVDMVGSFTPAMREADDELMARATLFVDSSAAYVESGDLVQPVAKGILSVPEALPDLRDLCTGAPFRRTSPEEITVFKSVGYALEDLLTAALLYASSS